MIDLIPDFLPQELADTWLVLLLGEVPWEQHRIRMYGRILDVPRLTAWYGDHGTDYQYSGIPMRVLPWTDLLREIRVRVETACGGHTFNSVLLNQYRNGLDSVSWHADDEPELGDRPFIASLSLGQARDFHLKPKFDKDLERLTWRLPHGSLLLMGEGTQERYLHAVPKRRSAADQGIRINLTFRHVLPRD